MYVPKRKGVECPSCEHTNIVDTGGPSPHVHEHQTPEGEWTREGIVTCEDCDALLGFDPDNVEDVWLT